MSKLYKKYISLKIENPNKIYLFKVGIFYIFLDDDARLMSTILKLKLTKLNSVIFKCGFPVNSSEKYFNLLKKYNYDICVVDENDIYNTINSYKNNNELKKIALKIVSVDINSLSISDAFELLSELQKSFNILLGEDINNETKI
mgnify:FL=1